MKNYNYILFDLDGTLTDPGIGITNSVMYALRKFGIEEADRTKLYAFIGPPLIDSFQKYYGFSKEKAREAVEYYREYFTEKGMLENYVYEGVEEMLAALVEAGMTLCLATSKPEPYAKIILEHFGLSQYFHFIAGAKLDETRTKKDEVIEYALELCGISDSSKVIMVGDREYDILGAKKFAMDSMGVLYGYGNREELESAGATYIAETVRGVSETIQDAIDKSPFGE